MCACKQITRVLLRFAFLLKRFERASNSLLLCITICVVLTGANSNRRRKKMEKRNPFRFGIFFILIFCSSPIRTAPIPLNITRMKIERSNDGPCKLVFSHSRTLSLRLFVSDNAKICLMQFSSFSISSHTYTYTPTAHPTDDDRRVVGRRRHRGWLRCILILHFCGFISRFANATTHTALMEKWNIPNPNWQWMALFRQRIGQ